MTRKHFKELAKILNENKASKELVKDVILFFYIIPIRKDKLLWHYLENILEKSLEYLAKI